MDFKDYIHIDEKWFYLTKCKRSYYVLLGEEIPQRTCKNKRFISKVMVAYDSSLAHPRWPKNAFLMEKLVYGHSLRKRQPNETVRTEQKENLSLLQSR